jgi:hypothetical protein
MCSFFNCSSSMTPSLLVLWPQISQLYQSLMISEYGVLMEKWGHKNKSAWRKTYPIDTLLTTNTTWSTLELNLASMVRRWQLRATHTCSISYCTQLLEGCNLYELSVHCASYMWAAKMQGCPVHKCNAYLLPDITQHCILIYPAKPDFWHEHPDSPVPHKSTI